MIELPRTNTIELKIVNGCRIRVDSGQYCTIGLIMQDDTGVWCFEGDSHFFVYPNQLKEIAMVCDVLNERRSVKGELPKPRVVDIYGVDIAGEN